MRMLALLIPTLLLAACNKPDAAKEPASGAPSATTTATEAVVPAGTTAMPAVARTVNEKSDLYEFSYAYPAAAAAIPALKAVLDADLDKQKSELAAEATKDKKGAEEAGFPYRTYSRGYDWKVVTETPGWLSLSSLVSIYTGGAHPNSWFETMLWDKQANQRRDPKDLFVSKEALANVIKPEFCRQIDAQRAKKRGEPVKRDSDGLFDGCLNPMDYVVILGSGSGKAFDRIGVLVPPYEAGPYVEGAYEATIPVNAAILETVKPQVRSSFAVAR